MMMMDEIPSEVIKKILEKSIKLRPCRFTREELDSWQRDYTIVAQYRLVCKTWLWMTDEILLSSELELIRAWLPNRHLCDLLPRSISRGKMITTTITTSTSTTAIIPATACSSREVGNQKFEIFYPPFMDNYTGCNPYPGKSFMVEGHERDDSYEGGSPIFGNGLVIRFALNVSVLCLSGLSLYLDNFCYVLRSCSNVKALIIQKFYLGVKAESELVGIVLPPLPKLNSLVLLKYFYLHIEGTENAVVNNTWLFNSYVNQLEKLDIIFNSVVHVDPMPKLKQLSITTSSLTFLNQIGPATSLERISISSVEGIDHLGAVNDLFIFLSKFSNTLVEAYLDVSWSDFFNIQILLELEIEQRQEREQQEVRLQEHEQHEQELQLRWHELQQRPREQDLQQDENGQELQLLQELHQEHYRLQHQHQHLQQEEQRLSQYHQQLQQEQYELQQQRQQLQQRNRELYEQYQYLLHLDQQLQIQEQPRLFQQQLQFTRVCTLTLPFPLVGHERKLLTDFVLEKFPSLQQLFLIYYDKGVAPMPIYYCDQTCTVSERKTMLNYWRVSTSLRKITIRKEWISHPSNPSDFVEQSTYLRPTEI